MSTPVPPPTAEPAAEAPPQAPTKAERRAQKVAEFKMDLKWASALLFVLILSISGWLWSAWDRPTAGEEELPDVTAEIFATDGLVVPFEVLSVLLLAALIAGIVIAYRDPEGEA